MAMALREELGSTNRAIKMAMRWTGASERTVKFWLAGEQGPSGDPLIALERHSDAVLFVLLALVGRHVVEDERDRRPKPGGSRTGGEGNRTCTP